MRRETAEQSFLIQEGMATAGSFLSEDQFQCSICLDVFTEPVSIPCGHNFCRACLTRHWADKQHCQCPLCNEKFSKDLKLRVNIAFREVVENFKKHQAIPDGNSPVKPGEVPCDCCPGNKVRASKTCLVCLTSYCKTHLEPHQRVSYLKRHKLTNPVHKLENKICSKHNRILEFFCRTDQTRVCAMCAEHSAHDTVPLKEEYVDKKARMGNKNSEVHEFQQKQGKKAQKKEAAQSKRKGKGDANNVEPNQMQADPNEDPQCVDGRTYIPVNNSLCVGRFYYEVKAKRQTCLFLGVVRALMYGNGTFLPDSGDGHWTVMLECKNCRTPLHIPVWITQPEGVTLFVDYEKGFVSFRYAGYPVMTFTFNSCKFSQRLSLVFTPRVSWTQRLLGRVQTTPRFYEVLCWFIAFMVVLVLFT
ncbi:tripartite motif-containing protein 47-like [Stegastes partitus]|uniref:Tripartite motif-containing protein 47-like n=1 Tax=Stegastes partitus TaxID=144197 RepID=A0A3B5A3A5_9TELE|nr:PREDICTED: tripartite motif-containing protein 47-like [Stegastes partitus]